MRICCGLFAVKRATTQRYKSRHSPQAYVQPSSTGLQSSSTHLPHVLMHLVSVTTVLSLLAAITTTMAQPSCIVVDGVECCNCPQTSGGTYMITLCTHTERATSSCYNRSCTIVCIQIEITLHWIAKHMARILVADNTCCLVLQVGYPVIQPETTRRIHIHKCQLDSTMSKASCGAHARHI